MQVQETMYLQMQGPQKPLPRIPPAFPHGTVLQMELREPTAPLQKLAELELEWAPLTSFRLALATAQRACSPFSQWEQPP